MMIGYWQRMALVLSLGLFAAAPAAWSQEADEETPNEVAFLIKALRHPEPRIRQNAVDRLTQLPDKPFDALVPVLATGEEFDAATAAVVLARLKSPGVPIPETTEAALYQILRSPGTEAWRWNMTATLLAGLPNDPVRSDEDDSEEEEPMAPRETGIAESHLKDHVDLWTWGVRHPSPLVQLPSLRALQKTKQAGKPAESAVENLLHREGPPLTSYVLRPKIVTDGKIGLEQPLPDYDPLVILETLVAIQADPHRMVDPLKRLMHHPSEYIRLDAAAMLGKIDAANLEADPRPDAAKTLADLAMLPWGNVRAEAVRELGNMGAPAAVVLDTLIRMLNDANGRVRIQAAIALGNMGTAAKPALPALKAALEYAELDTRDAITTIQTAIQKIEMAIREQMI